MEFSLRCNYALIAAFPAVLLPATNPPQDECNAAAATSVNVYGLPVAV